MKTKFQEKLKIRITYYSAAPPTGRRILWVGRRPRVRFGRAAQIACVADESPAKGRIVGRVGTRRGLAQGEGARRGRKPAAGTGSGGAWLSDCVPDPWSISGPPDPIPAGEAGTCGREAAGEPRKAIRRFGAGAGRRGRARPDRGAAPAAWSAGRTLAEPLDRFVSASGATTSPLVGTLRTSRVRKRRGVRGFNRKIRVAFGPASSDIGKVRPRPIGGP